MPDLWYLTFFVCGVVCTVVAVIHWKP